MRLGVREICEVVLKAKGTQRVGNKTFFKHEPVIYFDSLKTSTLEGAATTVYATGGRGNARLIAWEGERTLTFTMEDALISPISFSILSGAGLIKADAEDNIIHVHTTEYTDDVTVGESAVTINLKEKAYDAEGENYIYVMVLKEGEVVTEPYIPNTIDVNEENGTTTLTINATFGAEGGKDNDLTPFTTGGVVLVDYYVEKTEGAYQIDISPDEFGGNYYLEASTLFRQRCLLRLQFSAHGTTLRCGRSGVTSLIMSQTLTSLTSALSQRLMKFTQRWRLPLLRLLIPRPFL